MDYKTALAFIGGAIAGNYLVRRYLTRHQEHMKHKPITYEQVQNELELNKFSQQQTTLKDTPERTSQSTSPYAALYSNKK